MNSLEFPFFSMKQSYRFFCEATNALDSLFSMWSNECFIVSLSYFYEAVSFRIFVFEAM